MTSAGEAVPVHVWGPGARHPRWHEPGLAATRFDTLASALAACGDGVTVVADGAVAPGRDLPGDVRRASADSRLAGLPWYVLAAGGTTFGGHHRSNATWPAGPARAADYVPAALVAADPGLLVVRGEVAEPARLVADGWERGMASYLTPHLRYSVDALPDSGGPATALGTAEAERRLDAVRPRPTVAAVVRTSLRRPHLLRRCVASLAVGGAPDAVLLVGEAPAADLADAARELGAAAGLPVEPHPVDGGVPGRTAALAAGITRAGADYAWFVDDDDAAAPDAVASIRAAVHTLARPLVVGSSVAYEESWSGERLVEAVEGRRWDAAAWPRAFTGWNFLPICSVAYPRELAQARLEATPLRHDLGEDYALLLLVLATPGLDVVQAAGTLARVSIRDDGTNVVTDADRTEWLRDGAAFASDLASDPHAGSPVLWALGDALRDSVPLARHEELVAAASRPPAWRALARRAVPERLRPALRRLLRGGGRRP